MNRDLRHALGRSAAKREVVKSQSLQIGGVDRMTEISQSVSATLSLSRVFHLHKQTGKKPTHLSWLLPK